MEMQQVTQINQLKQDFPILQKKAYDKRLVYLDSSATSLTPSVVVTAMQKYYNEYNANIHRSVHKLGERATEEYVSAHKKVARFINASIWKEIVFTKGTTESLNLLAYSLTKNLQKGDEIVLTQMEHHSNIVPWQQVAKEKELAIKFIKVTEEGRLDEGSIKECITNKTKIVSITHMSNVLGTINDVRHITKLAHSVGALCIIDAAQSIPHLPVDVQELDCDFLCFSAHKMCGPTGIGVLYGKKDLLETMDPFQFGGDMISEVTFTNATWNELPWKFEAGTPPIAEATGLAEAVKYLEKKGMEQIREIEEDITTYALEQLKKVPGVTVHGPTTIKERGSVISFSIAGVHAHDISTILDRENIAVRGGHLCAMPLVKEVLKVSDVCRASFYLYNTKEDVDALIEGIKKVKEIFQV